MALGMEVGLGPVHIVLDGNTAPSPKKGAEPPIFGPCLLWPNGWMHQDVTWYGGIGLIPCDFVLDGNPAPYPQKGQSLTQFLAHVYCGQMAGWMAKPLGTEVDLGPGHIALDGVAAPAKGAQQPPSFRPMSIVATVAHLSYC